MTQATIPHRSYSEAIESQDFSGYARIQTSASMRARKLAETADPVNARKLIEMAEGMETVRGVVAAHFPNLVKA